MTEEFAFEEMPRLETKRLVLRRFDTRADIDALFDLFADPEVARYTDTGPFSERADAVEVAEWIDQIFAERVGMRWAITIGGKEGSLVGTAGFNHWDAHNSLAEIGYDLARDHWGQGLMTEALEAIVEFGFEAMNLNRIEADVTVGNDASIAVLEKLGFNREGLFRQRAFWKGSYHDLVFLGLLRADWERHQS
ncbi:MAG: GNAT family N-acetyltransferase [Acidimicrobiia bacterium]